MNTSIVCFIDLDQLRQQNFKQNKLFLAICGSNQYVDRILRNFQAEFEQNHCLGNFSEWEWNFNYLVFYRAEFEQNKWLVEQNYEQNHNVQELGNFDEHCWQTALGCLSNRSVWHVKFSHCGLFLFLFFFTKYSFHWWHNLFKCS